MQITVAGEFYGSQWLLCNHVHILELEWVAHSD